MIVYSYNSTSQICLARPYYFTFFLQTEHWEFLLFVHKVPTKLASGIFSLSKMRHLCDTNTLKMVYFVYIHSTISFRMSLYGATSSKSSINPKSAKICNQGNYKYKYLWNISQRKMHWCNNLCKDRWRLRD